jgi:coenzyme F420-0:L-glutamate ligase / coenzyme F420-1:gamma-L-glutamate ligase
MNRRKEKFNFEEVQKSGEVIVSFPLPGIPEIQPGDSIASHITVAMERLGGVQNGDIFVIASKIVSKAENAIIDLRSITPSEEAIELSKKTNGRKSPELCEVILKESSDYVFTQVIVSKHKLGFQLTSAGVDRLDDHFVAILPHNPDQSARNIMNEVRDQTGKMVAVVVSDSEGRPDREGAGAISIGVAGIQPLRIFERADKTGVVKKTIETISDLLAASAAMQMGQRGKNTPVVCIRGFEYDLDPTALLSTILHSGRLLG